MYGMIKVKRSACRHFVYGLIAVFVLLMMVGCSGDGGSQQGTGNAVQAGEQLFNTNCSACHGAGAVGTNLGPPLIDRTYHPGHHNDFSIRNAIKNGVRSHHWNFGNMLPVAGVSEDDAEKIICYIRDTQLSSGTFKSDEYEFMC